MKATGRWKSHIHTFGSKVLDEAVPMSAHVAFVVDKVVLGHVSPCTVVSPCQLSCHQSSTLISPSSWAGRAGMLATTVPQVLCVCVHLWEGGRGGGQSL